MVEFDGGHFRAEIKHPLSECAESGTDFNDFFAFRRSGLLDDPVEKVFIDKKVLSEFAAWFESDCGEQGGKFVFLHAGLSDDVRIRRVRSRILRSERRGRTPERDSLPV